MVKKLYAVVMNSTDLKTRAIAIGALLYFINPIDLIPDFSGPLGLVDDIGVMTIALSVIATTAARKHGRATPEA